MIAKGLTIFEQVSPERLEDFIILSNKNGWHVQKRLLQETEKIALQLIYVGGKAYEHPASSTTTTTKLSTRSWKRRNKGENRFYLATNKAIKENRADRRRSNTT